MGNDGGARFAEILVAAGVIGVVVGVEHEAGGLSSDRAEGGADLFGEGSELVVDQEGAIRAGQHADVAALPGDHGDGPAHRHRCDRLFRLGCVCGVGCGVGRGAGGSRPGSGKGQQGWR